MEMRQLYSNINKQPITYNGSASPKIVLRRKASKSSAL